MLIVIAKFRTKSEKRQQMIDMAKGLLEPSRSEDGCIFYEFLQDPFDPDSFTFYERWRSREDLTLHSKEPHFKEFEKTFPELVVENGVSIVAYEVSGETKVA
jgi:quinol monooxygenase YgiN